jgi:hypothetical protein
MPSIGIMIGLANAGQMNGLIAPFGYGFLTLNGNYLTLTGKYLIMENT